MAVSGVRLPRRLALLIVLLVCLVAFASSAAADSSVDSDSDRETLETLLEAISPDPLPTGAPASDEDAFDYRDQTALRHAVAEDAEPEALTLAVADDLDDTVSSLAVTHPRLPSLLAPIAALSYIHLLYMTSASKSYVVETLQLLAFACFPTLPLIQLVSNAHKTVLACFRARNTPGSSALPARAYILAGLGGMYAFRRSETFPTLTLRRRRVAEYPVAALHSQPAHPLRSFVYPLELLTILGQLAAAALALTLSWHAPQRSDWDLASLGVDQRAWWTALGGAVASALCLLLHLTNRAWVVGGDLRPHALAGAGTSSGTGKSSSDWKPRGYGDLGGAGANLHALPAAPGMDGVDAGLLWEATVLAEIVCAALLQDAAVAWGGGSYSLVGGVAVFLANRVVLGVVFILGLLFNRVIRRYAARRWQNLGGGSAGGLDSEDVARRRRWEATLRPLFVVGSCAVCAGIIVLQIVTAASERGVSWRPAREAVH